MSLLNLVGASLIFLAGTLAGWFCQRLLSGIIRMRGTTTHFQDTTKLRQKAADYSVANSTTILLPAGPPLLKEQEYEKVKAIPLVLLVAAITLLTWLQPAYQQAPFYIFVVNMLFIWLFFLIALVDYYTHLIYLKLVGAGSLLATLVALVTTFFSVVVGLIIATSSSPREFKFERISNKSAEVTRSGFSQLWPLNIYDSLAGALTLGLIFSLLYFISRFIARAEVFGQGDVVLALLVGEVLGFKRTLIAVPLVFMLSLITAGLIILIAYLNPSPSKKEHSWKNRFIAFGPFLAASAISILILSGLGLF